MTGGARRRSRVESLKPYVRCILAMERVLVTVFGRRALVASLKLATRRVLGVRKSWQSQRTEIAV